MASAPGSTRRTGRRDWSEREALREQWRAAGWYGDVTIGEAIAAGARDAARRPDRLRTVRRRRRRSARCPSSSSGPTRRRADSESVGVGPGDAVVVQSPADAAGVELFVALWLLGAVVVPLVATAGPDEIDLAIAETGARVDGRRQPGALVPGTDARPVRPVVRRGAVDRGRAGARPGRSALDDVEPSRTTRRPRRGRTRRRWPACSTRRGRPACRRGSGTRTRRCSPGSRSPAPTTESRTLTSFPAGHVASILGLAATVHQRRSDRRARSVERARRGRGCHRDVRHHHERRHAVLPGDACSTRPSAPVATSRRCRGSWSAPRRFRRRWSPGRRLRASSRGGRTAPPSTRRSAVARPIIRPTSAG